jgi:7,8-dihydro-6-hydroxymethylpterin-pyrophosphokinase
MPDEKILQFGKHGVRGDALLESLRKIEREARAIRLELYKDSATDLDRLLIEADQVFCEADEALEKSAAMVGKSQ